ncbi:putative membrane protein [Waddlia chondrophila 2032/99]|nr:hypothetical protein [Waddlia chondrophila]CCB92012.1 putative membrane protein [Waddlia chondrophila 2032/99]
MERKNRKEISYSFILIPTFLWIGFVCSISFMEAWLKFRAPNVSLSIGLGIGKLIFSALNIVEWFFLITTLMLILFNKKILKFRKTKILIIPILILLSQTFFLLPLLNERTDIISQGMIAPKSSIHVFYILVEFIKVISLFIFGLRIIYDSAYEISSN